METQVKLRPSSSPIGVGFRAGGKIRDEVRGKIGIKIRLQANGLFASQTLRSASGKEAKLTARFEQPGASTIKGGPNTNRVSGPPSFCVATLGALLEPRCNELAFNDLRRHSGGTNRSEGTKDEERPLTLRIAPAQDLPVITTGACCVCWALPQAR